MRFYTLVNMADKVMKYKYIVKNVAAAGNVVNFMPKPLFGDNGSGMHFHQTLWKEGQPLFGDERLRGAYREARYYIGGLLTHARTLRPSPLRPPTATAVSCRVLRPRWTWPTPSGTAPPAYVFR